MCGIFGAIIVQPTQYDFVRIENLFRHLESRGTHASGVAWIKDRRVHIEREGIPARHFVDCVLRLDQMVNEDGNLYMLGHTRWTTSNVFDHQPIGDSKLAIAHNGIVTEAPPEHWYDMFGYRTKTQNDSELIYQALRANDGDACDIHPLEMFPDASLGVLELETSLNYKVIRGYRNHARPLAISNTRRSIVFSSTKESLRDTGWTNVFDCLSWEVYQAEVYRDRTFLNVTMGIEPMKPDLADYGDK